MTEVLLTAKEVMERLRISRPTLYALIARGKITPIPDDRPYLNKREKLLFKEADIQRLLDGSAA